jgi:hypothetical protein
MAFVRYVADLTTREIRDGRGWGAWKTCPHVTFAPDGDDVHEHMVSLAYNELARLHELECG